MLVITFGILLVKVCPPLIAIAALFHSWIPNNELEVSSQYVPSTGSAVGTLALGSNDPKSIGALTTHALLLTPKNEYAACKPYSLSSLPWIGLLFASIWKIGSPNVSARSRCEVIK